MANRNYNMYDGIDFSMFEPKQSSYEKNAARKIETVDVPLADKPKMELVKKPKKTLVQVKNCDFDFPAFNAFGASLRQNQG